MLQQQEVIYTYTHGPARCSQPVPLRTPLPPEALVGRRSRCSAVGSQKRLTFVTHRGDLLNWAPGRLPTCGSQAARGDQLCSLPWHCCPGMRLKQSFLGPTRAGTQAHGVLGDDLVPGRGLTWADALQELTGLTLRSHSRQLLEVAEGSLWAGWRRSQRPSSCVALGMPLHLATPPPSHL